MPENNTPLELTEQDEADLASLHALPEDEEAFEYHPVLMVWREVLAPATEEATRKVTPQWASRICSAYQQIEFADMEQYRNNYFGKVEELRQILLAEIATDEECLRYTTPEEDAAENGEHYRNLLRDWQKAVLGWELDWETTAPDAAVELAAISEVHKMFFGPTGVTAYLDNIGFEYTEAHQSEMAAALEEFRAEREGQ